MNSRTGHKPPHSFGIDVEVHIRTGHGNVDSKDRHLVFRVERNFFVIVLKLIGNRYDSRWS